MSDQGSDHRNKKVREEVETSTYAAEPVARVSFEPPPMNGEPEKAGF